MKLSDLEKTKLRANFMNSIASSSIVGALVTPVIGLSIGAIPATVDLIVVGSACAFWGFCGLLLHFFAARTLDKLE